MPGHAEERRSNTLMGKGSAPRPFTDREFYESEHDRIFRKGQADEQPKEAEHGSDGEREQS